MKSMEGLVYEGEKYSFSIAAFVADAPARSFLKCCKQHNAYNGCEKCVCNGKWDGRVIFDDLASELRTDESFKIMNDSKHHLTTSPLAKLEIGLVTSFPLDYMHLACLGVTRKLLYTWTKLKVPQRLQLKQIDVISQRMISVSRYICFEFSRKSRSVKEMDHFKATEFRLFLLYIGPVVMKVLLSEELYNHFILLHCAFRILVSENAKNKEWNIQAAQLLKSFVVQSKVLYGDQFLVYNVHNLIHIANDCLKYGKVDNFCAFPFENAMQPLKKMLRSKNYSLQQIVRRLSEIEVASSPTHSVSTEKLINLYKFKGEQRLKYGRCLFVPSSDSDSCFLARNDKVVIVKEIKKVISEVKLVCEVYNLYNISDYPFASKRVGVGFINLDSEHTYTEISLDQIVEKCLLIPDENVEYRYWCIALIDLFIK